MCSMCMCLNWLCKQLESSHIKEKNTYKWQDEKPHNANFNPPIITYSFTYVSTIFNRELKISTNWWVKFWHWTNMIFAINWQQTKLGVFFWQKKSSMLSNPTTKNNFHIFIMIRKWYLSFRCLYKESNFATNNLFLPLMEVHTL